ncbi:MAG: hypothetical protein IPO19_09450 [Rhodoferax sp.]|nr:hypothetical protein [Rhodoferax sp.]
MDKTMAITAEYMNTRSSSALSSAASRRWRHRAADMKMQFELARLMSHYASLKLTAPLSERRGAALSRAAAFSLASQCVLRASRRCNCTAVLA